MTFDNRGDLHFILAFRIGLHVFLTGVVLAGSLFRRRGFASAESRSRSGDRCLSVAFFVEAVVDTDNDFNEPFRLLVVADDVIVISDDFLGTGEGLLFKEGDGLRLRFGEGDLFTLGEGLRFGPGEGVRLGGVWGVES